MQCWRFSIALKFPRKHCGLVFVVAQRLAFGRLVFFAKMPAARFVALESVDAHQLREFQKIGDATRAFERLVKILVFAEHTDIAPKFFAQLPNFHERLARSFGVPGHSTFVPKKKTELTVDGIE